MSETTYSRHQAAPSKPLVWLHGEVKTPPFSTREDTVKTGKLEQLQTRGWKVGNADDFLQLSAEESKLVILKVSLIGAVKKTRIRNRLSQIELAQRM